MPAPSRRRPRPSPSLRLGGAPLDLGALERLLGDRPPRLDLDDEARRRVGASRRVVDAAMAGGQVRYGINTGFGKLAQTEIPAGKLGELQVNLVRSHACGVGDPLSPAVSRLAFALRIANLSRGHSGVRPKLVDHALAVFNAGIVPVIPAQGSVSASGDLAPLAHLALVLIGEGHAWHRGRRMTGRAALDAAGLRPIKLHSKEGLALLNGTQICTALLIDALLAARRLAEVADVACALTLEAYKGTPSAYDPRIQAARGHAGQIAAAAHLRALLEGSRIIPGHAKCTRVQDPYSLRCAPQVHGAARDVLDHVQRVVEIEANAVTDNPLVFEDGDILSGGNFHGEPVAMAADTLKLAAAELASISERRIELLVNPDLSGLPAFLARQPGLESGLMIAQVTAAALVSENKVLAHPACVDSIPTSAGKEDHVSMGAAAARQARAIVDNARRVLAIELIAGFHGLALERKLRPGRGVAAARKVLGSVVAPLTRDRVQSDDIEAVAVLIEDGTLLEAVRAALPAGD